MEDVHSQINTLIQQAHMLSQQGKLKAALCKLDVSLPLTMQSPELEALVWRWYGNIHDKHHQYKLSYEAHEKAIMLCQKHDLIEQLAITKAVAILPYYKMGRESEVLRWEQQITSSLQNIPAGLAAMWGNLAKVYLNKEWYGQAKTYYQQCYDLFCELGQDERAAHVLMDMGLVAEQTDRLDDAQQYYNDAFAMLVNGVDVFLLCKIAFNSASLAIRRGRVQFALEKIAELRRVLDRLPNSADAAYADLFEGKIQLLIDERHLAEELLTKAKAALIDQDEKVDVVDALIHLSRTLGLKHRWQERLILLEQARQLLADTPESQRIGDIQLEEAEIYLWLDDTATAIQIAQAAHGRFDASKLVMRAAQAQVVSAEALMQDEPTQAEGWLREAADLFLGKQPYWHARCLHGIGRIQTQINGNDKQAEKQYLAALEVFSNIQLSLHQLEHQAGFGVTLQKIQHDLIALRHRTSTAATVFETLEAFKASSLVAAFSQHYPSEQTRLNLASDTATLSYFDLNGQIHVAIGSNQAVSIHLLDCTLDLFDTKWTRMYRQIIRPKANQKQALQALSTLWRWLIAPLVSHIAQYSKLIILPHGKLHAIPFAALYDRTCEQYLLQRWQIQTAPSLTIHQRCEALTPTLSVPLLIGYAGEAGADDYLPHVEQEIDALKRWYNDLGVSPQVLTRKDATAANILAHFGKHHLIHIAGHIRFHPTRNGLSGIPLAEKSWLGATELYNRRAQLEGAVVILSGCESGRIRPKGHDMTGLLNAFLYAGAKHIVSSLWKVEDSTTMAFMQKLHAKLQSGITIQQALRETQLDLIDEPPCTWAAWQAL